MTAIHRSILYHDRPVSSHPKMQLGNRAKLFTPFSALRGFDIAILTREQDRTLVPRACLSRDREEQLDRMLCSLRPGDEVTVTRFLPIKWLDGQEMGEYTVGTDIFRHIDRVARLLILENSAIPLENIREVQATGVDWGDPYE